jgi:hypothetical protein
MTKTSRLLNEEQSPTRPLRIYVASSWRNEQQQNVVAALR